MCLDLNVQEPVMVVQEPQACGKGSSCEEAVVPDGARVVEEGNAAACQ